MSKPFQKPRRFPDLRQIDPAVEGRIHHGRARHGRKERKKERKEAERRKAQFHQPPHLQGAARVQRDAHAFRRSTAVLVQGTHASQGLSSGPGFAERSAKDGRGLPPAPAPVTASTSRAGHGAGRHDVRCRPGAMVTSPCPRAPQPAPPDGVTGRRPCKRARWAFLVRRAARIQEIPPSGAIPLI